MTGLALTLTTPSPATFGLIGWVGLIVLIVAVVRPK